jgi:hypothetical protein
MDFRDPKVWDIERENDLEQRKFDSRVVEEHNPDRRSKFAQLNIDQELLARSEKKGVEREELFKKISSNLPELSKAQQEILDKFKLPDLESDSKDLFDSIRKFKKEFEDANVENPFKDILFKNTTDAENECDINPDLEPQQLIKLLELSKSKGVGVLKAKQPRNPSANISSRVDQESGAKAQQEDGSSCGSFTLANLKVMAEQISTNARAKTLDDFFIKLTQDMQNEFQKYRFKNSNYAVLYLKNLIEHNKFEEAEEFFEAQDEQIKKEIEENPAYHFIMFEMILNKNCQADNIIYRIIKSFIPGLGNSDTPSTGYKKEARGHLEQAIEILDKRSKKIHDFISGDKFIIPAKT